MAAIHSARLAPGHRQAFSPTAMIGWSIANEPFMDDQNVVNNLTLSVSGGILNTDLDIQGYYLYAPAYAEGAGSLGPAHLEVPQHILKEAEILT